MSLSTNDQPIFLVDPPRFRDLHAYLNCFASATTTASTDYYRSCISASLRRQFAYEQKYFSVIKKRAQLDRRKYGWTRWWQENTACAYSLHIQSASETAHSIRVVV